MRTGELGELPFLLTSLLHEETHLFNFASLGKRAQGWWAGEFCCIYLQERAFLEQGGRDLKQELKLRLPHGPLAPLAELEAGGKDAFDSATAAQFFLEEKYGKQLFDEFRRQCLLTSKISDGGRLPEGVFRQVFGKGASDLNAEWRAFYGWLDGAQGKKPASRDARLDSKMTYSVQKESVQYVVQKWLRRRGWDTTSTNRERKPTRSAGVG